MLEKSVQVLSTTFNVLKETRPSVPASNVTSPNATPRRVPIFIFLNIGWILPTYESSPIRGTGEAFVAEFGRSFGPFFRNLKAPGARGHVTDACAGGHAYDCIELLRVSDSSRA